MGLGYDGYSDNGIWAFFAAAMGFWLLFILALVVIVIVAWWKFFEKAGEEGWKALVPVLNFYTLSKIAWGNGWFFLLALAAPIPLIGWFIALAYNVMTCYKIAKNFGKEVGFAAGLFFIPWIFYMILGFGNAQYLGIYDGRGGYYNPNYPPMGGFPAPWDMFTSSAPQNNAYGQQPYGGYQGQQPYNGYQGQPNQPHGGYQGEQGNPNQNQSNQTNNY